MRKLVKRIKSILRPQTPNERLLACILWQIENR
jgi:hypothetical protein